MKKSLFLLIFCLCHCLSFSQKLKWTVYDQNKKKTYTEVSTCPSDYPKQDEDANYYCFKNYTVKELDFSIVVDAVIDIVQNKNNDTLWFSSTVGGLASFSNLRWKSYTTNNSFIPSNIVNRAFHKDGFGTLVSTDLGIHYFGPKSDINSHFPEIDYSASGLLVDNNDALWIAYSMDGLWKTNGTDYTQWIDLNSSTNGPFNGHIYQMGPLLQHSKTNNIWVYAKSFGVFEYDGINWITHSSVPTFSGDGFVNPFYEDSKGNVWIGTSEGLFAYDGAQWKEYSTANTSFKSNFIRAVFEDSRKNFWVMTENDISVYDGKGWVSYELALGRRSSSYRKLIMDDDHGNIWVATKNGLLFFDGYKWTKYTTDNSPLPNNEITTLFRDRANNIWVGTRKGLACIQHEDPAISLPYSIRGTTFLDKNLNDIYDKVGESAIPSRKVLLLPDNVYAYSNDQGYYQFHVTKPGSYTIKTVDDEAFVGTKEVTVEIEVGINTNVDLPYLTGSIGSDTLAFAYTKGIARCNGIIDYWLDIKNQGTADFNGKLTFDIDPVYTFIGASITPSESTQQEIIWNDLSVPALTTKQIKLKVNLPGIEHINDDVKFGIIAQNQLTEKTFNSQIVHKLLCAYDPNDKSVMPERENILRTDELEYLVRFQNTGNDTAFTVVLRDTLSSLLDKGSVEVLSASHKYEAIMDIKSGEMVFMFNNIQLPDDKVDEPGSHGFIKYKVRLKSDIPFLSRITNTAYIYFDRNPAIITNTTQQVLVDDILTSIPDAVESKTNYVYPNPVKDVFYTQDKEGRLMLYNQLGKVVAEGNADGAIEVSGINPGIYILHQVKKDQTIIHKVEVLR